MDSSSQIRNSQAIVGIIRTRLQNRSQIYLPHRQCADVMRMAAFVRGHARSALSERRAQNERDAKADDPTQGPSRSDRRSGRIATYLGSVPTDEINQLGK